MISTYIYYLITGVKWASWRIKSPATRLQDEQLGHININENKKPHISEHFWVNPEANGDKIPLMRKGFPCHDAVTSCGLSVGYSAAKYKNSSADGWWIHLSYYFSAMATGATEVSNAQMHNNDVTWGTKCLKSPATQLFVVDLFRLIIKKTSKLHITYLYEKKPGFWWIPVMWKVFPLHDVLMNRNLQQHRYL